jgi:hypothetical protein
MAAHGGGAADRRKAGTASSKRVLSIFIVFLTPDQPPPFNVITLAEQGSTLNRLWGRGENRCLSLVLRQGE